MNILSLSSAILATAFWIGSIYCFTRNRKTQLNVFSLLVLFSLGWWNFCYSFFFSSHTAEEAMLWHRLASIGWTGFIATTTYYFIILTEFNKKMKNVAMQVCFYIFPTILLIHNLFSDTTSLATGVVRSRIGNQWTLVNSASNIWLWLYAVCLFAYFGFSFVLLFLWANRVNHSMKRHMALGFIALDVLTIFIGCFTDAIMPLTNQAIPSVANLGTSIFAAGYFFIIIRYDLFNVRNIVEDRTIIEQSMDSMMVTDEKGEVLDVNFACCNLLNTSKERLLGKAVYGFFEDDSYKEKISSVLESADQANGIELSLNESAPVKKQIQVSASVIRDRNREYVGTVLSMRDITQLSELRERYHMQSRQYKQLAYMDALTGLPNRRKAFEHINECTKDYAEKQQDFFVIYMDVDNFKFVNDKYGHHIGDVLLNALAERLKSCMTANVNFLSRLGGDEFLFAGQTAEGQTVEEIISAIGQKFGKEFLCEGILIQSGISAGYARYSDYKNVDEMIHAADEMMYRQKNQKAKHKKE